jgi:hypothetical protein
MNYGRLADDLILRLSKSAPSDDLELEKGQIQYLLAQHRDQVYTEYLNSLLKNNQPLETTGKSRYTGNTLFLEDEEVVGIDDERMYVEVPHHPLPLINDMGVIQVLTQEYQEVLRYRIENFTVYNHLRFAKASPKNICFYKDGKRIIIKGLTRKNKDYDKFIIDYYPSQGSQTIISGTEVQLPDALLPTLLDRVEEVLRRTMELEEDTKNDGAQ